MHEFEIVGEDSGDEHEKELFKVQHYLHGIGIQRDDKMKILPYECFINQTKHDFFDDIDQKNKKTSSKDQKDEKVLE